MKQRMSSEFIYQLFALLIAVIVVHAVYVGVIRPSADAQIEGNGTAGRWRRLCPGAQLCPWSSAISSRKPVSSC